jgi:limonene-1,2-epoxide hydrolase
MNENDPETVVREFFASFGPTIDDMIAAARQFLHPDAYWASAGFDPPRVTGRSELIADLEKARANKGIAGFRFELVNVATTGNKVLTERYDSATDSEGNLVHEFRLMGILGIEGGKIRWARDYFYDTTEFAEHYLPEAHRNGAAKVLDGLVRSGR